MDNDVRLPKRPRKSVQALMDASVEIRQHGQDDTDSFRTPDEVAAEQTLQNTSEATQQTTTEKAASPATTDSWRQKLAMHWPPGKKEWLAIGITVVLLGGLAAILLLVHSPKPVAIKPVKAIPKAILKPTTVPSTLSGLPVDPSVNQRPVTGVMIENSDFARPQAGLGQASVVFEAIAEGGITRFMALYQDTEPNNVGPIRSARPYYAQWALGFDAGFAHVGGSPEALADIKAWGVRDLDQFANGGSYHRISARAAPHNVYTSISTMIQLEGGKGYTSSTFTGFVRKKEAPIKQPAPAKNINLTLSGPDYNVSYAYAAATNSYNRSEAGVAHTDANTNTTISPKVVIALVMPYSLEADGYHSDYSTIGSGPAYVFQDGAVTVGQWAKTSNASQFVFTDATGKSLPLNPGQTWLTAIAKISNISYTP